MTTQKLNEILAPYWAEGWDGYCRFDDGWAGLVYECHLHILKIDPNYKIHQIKEKFGTLRYYYESEIMTWVPEIDEVIEKYSEILKHVCENCGRDGSLCKNNWLLKTLCPDCANELNFLKCEKQ